LGFSDYLHHDEAVFNRCANKLKVKPSLLDKIAREVHNEIKITENDGFL